MTVVRRCVVALWWLAVLVDPAYAGEAALPSGASSWWPNGWWIAGIAVADLFAVGAFAVRQRAVLRRRTRLLDDQADDSFRAVIDLLPDLIAVHRRGTAVYFNLAARSLLGLDRTTTAISELVELIHPEDRPGVDELLDAADHLVPRRPSATLELRLRGGDGTWRLCEGTAIRVEIAGRSTVVTSGCDITERKRLRAKMLVTDRMASLGTLAAGIAHEINNPLAYVTGNLEVIAETLEDAQSADSSVSRDELTAAISDARDGAERVRKIVMGLRSFTRSDEEQHVAVDLSGVLDAAIRLTGNEVRHHAQLVREFGPIPHVLGDDSRLTQVFINLLVNAAHAIPEGHSDDNRITVRTRTDDHGNVIAEIEDTGAGMPFEIQARVFDPFFTTKEVGEGTGLGLSICRGIIGALGGQIVIESPPVGAPPRTGTIMRVMLPAYTAANAAAPPRTLAAPAAANRRT